MSRYTDAVCKLCRREQQKLFLKGERCLTDKCGVERRSYPPGEHGRGRKDRESSHQCIFFAWVIKAAWSKSFAY